MNGLPWYHHFPRQSINHKQLGHNDENSQDALNQIYAYGKFIWMRYIENIV